MPTIALRQPGKLSRSQRSEFLFQSIVAAMVLVFSVVSIVYLSHANSVATNGYAIKQLQEEQTYLQAERDAWNLKLSRLQALHMLEKSEKVAAMETLSDFAQFIPDDTQIAMAK